MAYLSCINFGSNTFAISYHNILAAIFKKDQVFLHPLKLPSSNPPRRGLASVGVGVLGAPDPAPEAVTNYYVTRPPPLEDNPPQNPAMQPLKMIAMEF